MNLNNPFSLLINKRLSLDFCELNNAMYICGYLNYF